MAYDELGDEKLLERVKACFKLCVDTEAKQRERERDDLSFQVPENQWDEESRKQRQGGIVGGQVVPPRPMLSISLLAQPLQLILNQAAQAKLGVDLHPVSESASAELGEIKQGLYRRIERDSNAHQARLWALDRAIQCGRGWYRVNTKWDEDGDDPLDQEIVVERIFRQDCVYIDPAAVEADFSDARWGMIVSWVPLETFEEEFPGVKVTAGDTEFLAWMKEEPEWARMDGTNKDKAVLVAEYFYKIHDRETVEVRVGKGKAQQTIKRTMDRVRVKYCKAHGRGVFDRQDWAGRYIPLVPVIGRELQPFDGERRWVGLVRGARDGQKFANYSASNVVEAMALEPKAPWIMAEGQDEGHEDEWDQANVRNFQRLTYKPTTVDGQLVNPPQRSIADGSKLTLALQAFSLAKDLVQTATAVHEPSLGQLPARKDAQSGRALLALQQQADAGTGDFLQNLSQISMAYEARVVLDLMPAIYDRPGRVTQVLGDEDDPKMVMLGRPFVSDQEGQPQELPPQQPGMPPMPEPAGTKEYDLSKGKYAVSVSVGKSYQTRLQEGQSEIGEVLQAQPNLMPAIGATYFRFRDFPGSKEIADILKKMRDQQYPFLRDQDDQSPEAMQAQLQQAQQELEQLQQQLEQAMKALETEQAKQQASIQKAQIDAQSTQQKAQIDAEAGQRKAETDAASAAEIARIRQETELAIAELKQRFDAMEAALNRQHVEKTQAMGAAHEVGMAAGQPADLTFRGENELPLDVE